MADDDCAEGAGEVKISGVLVYGLHRLDGTCFYVGKTCNPSARKYQHGKRFCFDFILVPLAIAKTNSEALEKERVWIKRMGKEGEPVENIQEVEAGTVTVEFNRLATKPRFEIPSTGETFEFSFQLASRLGCSTTTLTCYARRSKSRGLFQIYDFRPTGPNGQIFKLWVKDNKKARKKAA